MTNREPEYWSRGNKIRAAIVLILAFCIGFYAPIWDAMPWAVNR